MELAIQIHCDNSITDCIASDGDQTNGIYTHHNTLCSFKVTLRLSFKVTLRHKSSLDLPLFFHFFATFHHNNMYILSLSLATFKRCTHRIQVIGQAFQASTKSHSNNSTVSFCKSFLFKVHSFCVCCHTVKCIIGSKCDNSTFVNSFLVESHFCPVRQRN